MSADTSRTIIQRVAHEYRWQRSALSANRTDQYFRRRADKPPEQLNVRFSRDGKVLEFLHNGRRPPRQNRNGVLDALGGA